MKIEFDESALIIFSLLLFKYYTTGHSNKVGIIYQYTIMYRMLYNRLLFFILFEQKMMNPDDDTARRADDC